MIGTLHAMRAESPEIEGEELAAEPMEVTGLGREQISTALRYYANYSAEVDQLVRANHEATGRVQRSSSRVPDEGVGKTFPTDRVWC